MIKVLLVAVLLLAGCKKPPQTEVTQHLTVDQTFALMSRCEELGLTTTLETWASKPFQVKCTAVEVVVPIGKAPP